MNKNNKIIIGVLFVSLTVLLVVYFSLTKRNTRHHEWTESYKSTSDQPYGTLFIQKLLASYRPGENFIVNDNKPLRQVLDTAKLTMKTDYVFIGNAIFLDSADKAALFTFIASGNDAFMATASMPYRLIDSIFYHECNQPILNKTDSVVSVSMNFYNTSLRTDSGFNYSYRFGNANRPYYWNSLNAEIYCDSTKSLTPLGYIYPERVNFLRFKFGKGNLYLHCNPIVFTNYFLIDHDKVEYASRVFSHLNAKALIWDEFSKAEYSQSNAPEVNPLAYILQQESLRYAWWLMLLGVMLYVLFTAKRKQRMIPVLEEKANTSLEFVQMISVLHFQNGNPHDIARKKMKYFFYFIRAKYGIHIQKLTDVNKKRLSEKSKMELVDLDAISREFDRAENKASYGSSELIDLYRALEKAYKHITK